MTQMGQANLIARPGLFGKSFNMGMLKSYLEIGADPALFKGLAIEGETGIYDRHFGKYAVLHLDLAQVKGDSFEECLNSISLCLKGLFEGELKYLLKSDRLSAVNKRNLARISGLYEKIDTETAKPLSEAPDETYLARSLNDLTSILWEHHGGSRVAVFIDDYDSMMNRAVGQGYAQELLDFFSSFYGYVCKGNEQVGFVLMTGRMKIGMESFSEGANNVVGSGVLEPRYSDRFGFTEDEVAKVLTDFGCFDELNEIKENYGGYLFGKTQIYNPAAVLRLCGALEKPVAYWAGASGNDLLELVISNSESWRLLSELEALAFGGTAKFWLRDCIRFGELDDANALWYVLVHSGYLTPCGWRSEEYRVPNAKALVELGKVVDIIRSERSRRLS
jgi:hypothetical protein